MVDAAPRLTRQPQSSEKTEQAKRPSEAIAQLAGGLAGETAVFENLLSAPAMGLPVERHAALLSDTRLSHPANAGQKVRMVTRLQRDYGNGHVQRVLDTMTVQTTRGVDAHGGRGEKRAGDRPNAALKPGRAATLRHRPVQR